MLVRQRRFGDSVRAVRQSLDLNPNFAFGHAFLSNPLNLMGEHDKAIESAEHALRLSPHDRPVAVFACRGIAMAHFSAARYAESAVWAGNLIEKNPGHIPGYVFRIASLAWIGDIDAASAARDALLRLRPAMSVTWVAENLPMAGTIAEKIYNGLRKAGVPEE